MPYYNLINMVFNLRFTYLNERIINLYTKIFHCKKNYL